MVYKDNTCDSISDLEFSIRNKNFSEAERQVGELISKFSKNKMTFTAAPFDRDLTYHQRELESYQVIEKLACLLTSLFTDPEFIPSSYFFQYIATSKSFVSNLFAASSYHSTDHIVKNLGLLGKENYTLDEIKKILLVFGIESDIQLPWLEVFKHLPDETALTYTGLIANIGIHFSPRAVKNVKTLLALTKHMPVFSVANINSLTPYLKAYFNCSNLAEQDKYELKKWVVKIIQKYIDEALPPGIKKRLAKETKRSLNKEKPHIIIVCEHYKSTHAMYRGWHTSLAILKNKYNVTAVGAKEAFDDESKKDFNSVQVIDDVKDISAILKVFVREQPDIVLYTSIGMSIWAPIVATIRVAPVQVALSGHPSSTYIPNVDYFLLSNCPYDKGQVSHVYSEKLVQTKEIWSDAKALPYDPRTFYEVKSANTMRVVVNGVIQKISEETIKLCQNITNQVAKKVEFLFFMASPKQDIEYFAANSLLRRYIPNSRLIPFGPYQHYMDYLNSCDLAIPTMPFGGSNSNVDVLRLGIPKLLYAETTDVSAWSDLAMWLPTGLSDRFLCETKQELQDRAIFLLNNPHELAELKQYIIDSNPAEKLFTGNNQLPYVLDAIDEIIEQAG